jgi:LacI family transcriptional regulator
MVSVLDVARRAGVSPTTAKRAIRTPHLLAPQTLRRVQEAIATLEYEPNQTAGALRRGHSATIGLMVGNIVEPFFAQLTRSVARALRGKGYALIIADNEYQTEIELPQLRMFAGHRVAGLILRSAFGEPPRDYLRRLQEHGTFIIEIDYAFADSPFGHVLLDNRAAVEDGVRFLHGLGHRRIAALAAYDPLLNPEERSLAFPEALAAVGLAERPEYRQVLSLLDDGAAYRFTRQLMALPEPPTALFALTGNQCMGAFQALRDLDLRIPGDVSLLTFDNYPWTRLVDPPIDVIEQPVDAMGVAAVEALVAAIERGDPAAIPRRRLPGTFIRRGSCAAPPAR